VPQLPGYTIHILTFAITQLQYRIFKLINKLSTYFKHSHKIDKNHLDKTEHKTSTEFYAAHVLIHTCELRLQQCIESNMHHTENKYKSTLFKNYEVHTFLVRTSQCDNNMDRQ